MALKNWPVALEGVWTRWDPGYLLLTITSAGGQSIEPVVLYTADKEIMVKFGWWYEAFLSEVNTAVEAAEGAVYIIEQWLSGEFKTLVFRDAAGKWKKTTTVSSSNVNEEIVRDFKEYGDSTATVELCTACRNECRTIRLEGDRLIDQHEEPVGTLTILGNHQQPIEG